jgi:hypothetical protein
MQSKGNSQQWKCNHKMREYICKPCTVKDCIATTWETHTTEKQKKQITKF